MHSSHEVLIVSHCTGRKDPKGWPATKPQCHSWDINTLPTAGCTVLSSPASCLLPTPTYYIYIYVYVAANLESEINMSDWRMAGYDAQMELAHKQSVHTQWLLDQHQSRV